VKPSTKPILEYEARMLKVEKLHVGYTGSEVLHSVDLEAADGEITILIGPNGAGKSTLLKTVIGLVQPTAGKLYAKEREITHITILAYRPEPTYMFGLPVAVQSGLEAALIRKFQPPYNDRGLKADLQEDE